MKDKTCKTKECKNLICSKMNKSSLCSKCLTKAWKIEHDEEIKIYGKGYRDENKEEIKQKNKEFYKEHKDKFWEYDDTIYDRFPERFKRTAKKYYNNHKEEKAAYTLQYANRRYREDEGFRMRKKLGGALWKVIDNYIKTGKISNLMPKYEIDWKGIIKVLSPIPKDRHKYHVDHIIELWRFDLTDIEQIHIAFAPKNHRWLLAKENQERSRKP